MAKRSQRPVEPFWYVLPSDKDLPAAEQSRFRFRPLTQAERMDCMDSMEVAIEDGTGARQLRFRSFAQSREIVLLTLIDAENFPAGEPVPFPKGGSRTEKSRYLDLFEDSAVYAMGEYCFTHSSVGTDSKNS